MATKSKNSFADRSFGYSTIDAEEPPSETAFFYLVRATNAYAEGSLGAGSNGSQRTGVACGGGGSQRAQ